MSPEQARGKRVDKRSDVWAFGALLYEMLTGRRLFDGETVSDVLAAVLTRQPEWAALPAGTPASVRLLLERCLERDPKQRLRDIGEARIALAGAAAGPSGRRSAASGVGLRTWAAAGMGVAAALLLVAAYERFRPQTAVELPVRKLELAIEGFGYSAVRAAPAIAPDGQRLVYSASSRLWVRELSDAAVARAARNRRRPLPVVVSRQPPRRLHPARSALDRAGRRRPAFRARRRAGGPRRLGRHRLERRRPDRRRRQRHRRLCSRYRPRAARAAISPRSSAPRKPTTTR